jgi:O-antigen/teichoic acid export membrane protein
MAEFPENAEPMNRAWVRFLPAFLRDKVEGREYLQNVIGNTGWQFADQVLRMGIGLVIWIWLARYLGPDQFGLLSFALAFAALFSPLASLGLDDIAVRNLVRDPERGNETLGTAFFLKLAGGAASFTAAIIAILVLRPGDRLVHYLVVIIAAGSVFQAFNAIEFWFNSQVQAKYPVFARNVAFLSGAAAKIALILAGATLVAFAWVGTFEFIVGGAALAAVYRWKGRRFRDWRSSPAMAKVLLRDSWPLIFSCVVIMIYLRIDQVMLGEMVGSEEVGIYSVAVRMAEVWFFIPSAVYWSVLPSLVEAKESGEDLFHERLQKYYNLMALMAYAIAVPVTLLANWVVPAFFGASYARAGVMLAVLIWANLFSYLEIARSAYFNVMNWNRIYFVTLALGAAMNVILNLFLIPRYGGLGAAIASCLSYWFAAHGSCFLYKRLHRTGFMLTRAMFYPKIW